MRQKNFKCLLLLNQLIDFEIFSKECSLGDPLPKLPAEALNSNILCSYKSHPDVRIAVKMVCSIEGADP